MQSASDKVNTDNPESLFDFLDDEDNKRAEQSPPNSASERAARPQSAKSVRTGSGSRDPNASKPYPVIRKPVSVERSGPLRAPRPGDPVEAPPPLTDVIQKAPARAARAGGRREGAVDIDELDLDLDLGISDEDWPSSERWADRNSRPFPMAEDRPRTSFARKLGYVVATMLILAGVGTALYSVPQAQTWMDHTMASGKDLVERGTRLISGSIDSADTDIAVAESAPTLPAAPVAAEDPIAIQTTPPAVVAQDIVSANVPKSLNTLFREELARLEALMAEGAVDEAQRVLQTMDRAVYGYGAPEFTQIKERIAQVKGTEDAAAAVAAEQLAREQAIAAEAERVELARIEQQRAAAEALRLEEQRAEEARAAAEADRLAAVQREQDRQSAESEQITADRLAQEQARLLQLDVARRERALLEQERIAQEQLAAERSAQQEAASGAYQSSEWQVVDSEGNVTGTTEQIAARQREAARQQRLVDAQGRTDQNAAAGGASTQEQLALVEPVIAPTQSSVPQRISDSDLQRVYGRFSQLQNAIENRDINAVIQLTERSGIRIQQVMQMFENNVSIQTRLRNVSTLDAAGEIQGTLQITRLERADGSITGPPLNLGSVRLSSTRQGDGWSAIRW